MGADTLASKLRSISLFRDLPESDLERLGLGVVERRFQPGETVVREGEPGEELFLVVEGEFQVFLRQEALGFEKELRRVGPGDYFGEIALITGGKRLASVRSIEGGRALVLHRQHLLDLIARSPESALALCRGLAEYITQAQQGGSVLAFVSLDDYPGLREAHKLIPARISAFCRALAIDRQGDRVKVALVNPQDQAARSFLREVLRQYRVEFVATSERDFDRYRSLYLGRSAGDVVAEAEVERLIFVNPEGWEEPLGEHETARLLQNVFSQALRAGASDVHFEPGTDAGRVRLRIDGKMMPLSDAVPAKLFVQVVSRLKVMSELDITDRRMPQDGRFPLRVGERQVEVRVSVTPCQGGEKVVLRLLSTAQQRPDLHSLILSRPVALLVRDMFLSPSGLLLVCGPTGAGKTTTLYAGLHEIWKDSQTFNVVTAEDPVEYQLDFATQIGVNRSVGLDFPQILRTILRQDPDVILVGEVRDEESADIALEAAVTGHLVLSSLHTDFALEAVTRLRNLQVKSFLLASALRGVVCQKLVPRVCRSCAQEVPADDENVVQLRRAGILEPDWSGPLLRGIGCDACRSEGEIGRVGVYEILAVNDHLRDQIERNASWSEMNATLTPEVFIPMTRYSRFLLQEGVVSPERIREIFPMRRFAEAVTL